MPSLKRNRDFPQLHISPTPSAAPPIHLSLSKLTTLPTQQPCIPRTTYPQPLLAIKFKMSSYLNPNPNELPIGINALKLWLRRDITTPNFLSLPHGAYTDSSGRDTFTLRELQRALLTATLEIALKLDPEMENFATKVSGGAYCIEMDVDAFYEGRDLEIKSLVELDPTERERRIRTYDREACEEVLGQARGEIGWLEDQGRRLEVHMENAEMLIRGHYRRSFVFRPLPREWDVGGSMKGDVEMRDAEEEEDEEERAKRGKKERLEQFKREADVGFGTGLFDKDFEEEEEKKDSPLVMLMKGVKK